MGCWMFQTNICGLCLQIYCVMNFSFELQIQDDKYYFQLNLNIEIWKIKKMLTLQFFDIIHNGPTKLYLYVLKLQKTLNIEKRKISKFIIENMKTWNCEIFDTFNIFCQFIQKISASSSKYLLMFNKLPILSMLWLNILPIGW